MQRENKSHEEIAREIIGKWGYEEEYWWKPIKEALDTAIAETLKGQVYTNVKVTEEYEIPEHIVKKIRDTAIAEERKAFGGCTKCYGKGYSTVRYGFNAHADFIGDKSYEYGTKTHMKYCECDRGEQLKNLIK